MSRGMTNREAIRRILDHKRVHSLNEPRAVLINEALDLAIKALEEKPQGDLISRSEAKKLGATCLAKRNENGQLEAIISLDEVQTVETDIEIVAKDAYEHGYTDGWKERFGEPNERPQGEWIAREDMDYLDENKVVHKHFECNKCGLVHDFIDGHTSQYNYCPHCGAEMKGGAENG